MTLSIWPHYTALERDLPLKLFGHLTCFVVSPFQPKNRFDDLFELVTDVCQQLYQLFSTINWTRKIDTILWTYGHR
jgi:hypothetical protein